MINNLEEEVAQQSAVKALTRNVVLAENGFFLLSVSNPQYTPLVLDILRRAVPKETEKPLEINIYIPRTDPNYARIGEAEATEKIRKPYWQWLDDIQKKRVDDVEQSRLFVVDGSQTTPDSRAILIDHFAFMNATRDRIVGNPRGPVLAVIPQSLNIEWDIGIYSDLMSCCSGRFYLSQ